MGKSGARVIRKALPDTTVYQSFEEQAQRARDIRIEHLTTSLAYKTIAEKVGKSTFHKVNYTVDGLKEFYPYRPKMWSVSKMYPDALNGALYVDEPVMDVEIELAFEKQRVLKKLGFRAIVVEKNTTVDQALDQLGEL